jgi:hypothetical protein
MNSNNPLAVKPETENDPAREDFPSALLKFQSAKRRLQQQQ